MTSCKRNNYWVEFWTKNELIKNEDLQSQVGRTINKIPVTSEVWNFTLLEIERLLELKEDDILLDLCSGNGLLAQPFSERCAGVTAVDVSESLIKKIDTNRFPKVTPITKDIRDISFPPDTFSKAVVYFALQHFDESETIRIFESVYSCLRPGGIFLVGDIPDIDRFFSFFNTPSRLSAYFDSVKNGTPSIGTWFKKEILISIATFVGFKGAQIISQHPDLFNSHYRFDLLVHK